MVSKRFRVVIYEVLIDFPNLGEAELSLPETMRLEARTRLPLHTWEPAGVDSTSVAWTPVGEKRLWRWGQETVTSDQTNCGS